MAETNPVIERFINRNSDRAAQYLTVIEELMGQYERYSWAEETLIGIYDYVVENNTITDKQIQAIENIKAKPANPAQSYGRY